MMKIVRPYLEHYPYIAQGVLLDPTCTIIGQVRLEEEVSIWPQVVIRGDVNYITIGARTNVQDGSVLHVTHIASDGSNGAGFPLIIGEDVTIGHRVMLHGCTIGNRVLIGMGSIVLDGAIISDDVMIGAGSLVTTGKYLESGYLYMGSPARKVRLLSEEERSWLKKSALHYVSIKDNYLLKTPGYIDPLEV